MNANPPDPDAQLQMILESYEDCREEGGFARVRAACEELLKEGPEYRLIALQYLGLSFYQEQRYAEALPYLRKVAEEGQGIQDLFNLLMASVYDRQRFLEERTWTQLLLGLRETGPDDPTPGFVRYHYCRALDDTGRCKEARSQLEWLRALYLGLGARDDRACQRAGVPRFSEFLRTAEDVFSHLDCDEDEWEAWLASASGASS